MPVLTRVGPKFQVTIPKEAREQVGLQVGDLVEATPTADGLLLKPKVVVDKHPAIEKRLREGLADLQAGRSYGPFHSGKDLIQSLRPQAKAKRLKRTR